MVLCIQRARLAGWRFRVELNRVLGFKVQTRVESRGLVLRFATFFPFSAIEVPRKLRVECLGGPEEYQNN